MAERIAAVAASTYLEEHFQRRIGRWCHSHPSGASASSPAAPLVDEVNTVEKAIHPWVGRNSWSWSTKAILKREASTRGSVSFLPPLRSTLAAIFSICLLFPIRLHIVHSIRFIHSIISSTFIMIRTWSSSDTEPEVYYDPEQYMDSSQRCRQACIAYNDLPLDASPSQKIAAWKR